MSNYEPKPDTGVLFRNDKKESDNHPDYNGRIADENGREHWLSAWINESKDGRKYMKLSRGKPCDETAKQGADNARQANGQDSAPADDFEDSIPF